MILPVARGGLVRRECRFSSAIALKEPYVSGIIGIMGTQAFRSSFGL
jgi:hypothetical protein